jgi:hypothetical protein
VSHLDALTASTNPAIPQATISMEKEASIIRNEVLVRDIDGCVMCVLVYSLRTGSVALCPAGPLRRLRHQALIFRPALARTHGSEDKADYAT